MSFSVFLLIFFPAISSFNSYIIINVISKEIIKESTKDVTSVKLGLCESWNEEKPDKILQLLFLLKI